MLSIVGLALAANAPSLQMRSRPRDEPFVLNLRGGAEDAAPPAAPSVAPTALTPEEITEKLNGIPVFALLNKEGGIVSMRDPDGGDAPVCRWFVDATEAKMVLEAALAANPGTCHAIRSTAKRREHSRDPDPICRPQASRVCTSACTVWATPSSCAAAGRTR